MRGKMRPVTAGVNPQPFLTRSAATQQQGGESNRPQRLESMDPLPESSLPNFSHSGERHLHGPVPAAIMTNVPDQVRHLIQ